MRTLTLTATVMALAACQTTPKLPQVPEQVTVVVERYKPLPSWATEQLVKPLAASGKVGDRLENEEARGGVIDVANCHRRLLARLDMGEAVDKKECER
ncbi:hypothetical protein [Lysobacter olei]